MFAVKLSREIYILLIESSNIKKLSTYNGKKEREIYINELLMPYKMNETLKQILTLVILQNLNFKLNRVFGNVAV